MQLEIWTLADCPRCKEAKEALTRAGLPFVEQDIAALRRGRILDVDAMTELVLRDGQAPMIRCDGRFLSDVEFEALLLGTD